MDTNHECSASGQLAAVVGMRVLRGQGGRGVLSWVVLGNRKWAGGGWARRRA